jgi:hypothetical protein
MGERARRGVRLVGRGGDTLVAWVAIAFLPLGLIGFRRVVPGWPAWRGVESSENRRERGEDPSTSRFIFIINLCKIKTILIGLN